MQCHLYLPTRRKNGKVVKGRLYRARIKLEGDSKPQDIALGVTDEKSALAKLEGIRREYEQERAGLIPPRTQRDAMQKPLRLHMEDFLRDRETRRRNDRHVRQLEKKLVRLFDECGWKVVRDVTMDSFNAWRCKQGSMHPKTINEYHGAIRSMLNWMEQMERIPFNPLRKLEKVRTEGVEKRERRALTMEEVKRLLEVSGPRALAYALSIHTGLRRGECDQVQWRDIHLDEEKPFIRVRASTTKNHKAASIPVLPIVAQYLRKAAPADIQTQDLLFPDGVPDLPVMRKDLEAAGIPYIDAKGEYADFHSLRYTFCTMLALAGVSPAQAQKLMRHKDPALTVNLYTKLGLMNLWDAMDKLNPVEKNDTQIDTQVARIAPRNITWEDLEYMDPEEWECVDAEPHKKEMGRSMLRGGSIEESARDRTRTCTTCVTRS